MVQKSAHNEIYLCAMLTHMRLFSSVYTGVYSQGGSLNELLIAARIIANVRPMTGVNTL